MNNLYTIIKTTEKNGKVRIVDIYPNGYFEAYNKIFDEFVHKLEFGMSALEMLKDKSNRNV